MPPAPKGKEGCSGFHVSPAPGAATNWWRQLPQAVRFSSLGTFKNLIQEALGCAFLTQLACVLYTKWEKDVHPTPPTSIQLDLARISTLSADFKM